jgi:aquaporin Z
MPPHPTAGLSSPGRLLRDRRAEPRPEPGSALAAEADLPLAETLRRHWPEYGVEALFLCVFLLLAGAVSAWARGTAGGLLPNSLGLPARHALVGIAMGLVLMGMVYSPWGRRSGSHLNPAITLAYLRLGKIGRWDALFYLLAQVGAGLAAVSLLRSGVLLPEGTPPGSLSASIGPTGGWAAFVTALALSAGAMLLILFTSNHASWFRWTGVLYGLLAMLVVGCAAPLSGFGMNPARLLAVDLSGDATLLGWFNLLPPLLGMQLAVEAYRLFTGRSQVLCAKLAHNTHGRCIFRCQHPYQTRALALAALQRQAEGRRKARGALTGR